MTFRTLIHSAAAFAAPAILGAFAPSAQAYESLGGACSLEVRVNLAEDGRIVQRDPGTVRCLGMIGRQTVDPDVAGASVTGAVRRRGTRCEPALLSGSLRLDLRRLVSFDARPVVTFTGRWRGVGLGPADAVGGAGVVEGLAMTFAGTARLVPANLSCTSHTLQMELAFLPR